MEQGSIRAPSQSRYGLHYLPKRKTGRDRTYSSDSGCDMNHANMSDDLTPSQMDDVVSTWAFRLDGVVRQEVERAKEVTEWAKEALRHSEKSDGDGISEKKGEILRGWKRQMEGVLEFTRDLVECVNNDVKEVMSDEIHNKTVNDHETSSTIEEEMDEEDEDEIMKLFLLSAITEKKSTKKKIRGEHKTLMKEFMAIYKKNGKIFQKSRNASQEVQTAYSKIKKRRHSSSENAQDINSCEDFFNHSCIYEDSGYSSKMFNSIFEAEEIFDDWNWNLMEYEMVENIFNDWRWNLETRLDLTMMYYDSMDVSGEWNNFNFWKPELGSVGDELLVEENVDHDRRSGWSFWDKDNFSPSTIDSADIDSGCLADTEEDLKEVRKVYDEECSYWQDDKVNKDILMDLLDDVTVDEEGDYEGDEVSFWYENEANQDIINSLIQQEADNVQSESEYNFMWDDKSVVFSLFNNDEKETIRSPHDQSNLEESEIYIENNGSSNDNNEKEIKVEQPEEKVIPLSFLPVIDISFIWEDSEAITSLLSVKDEQSKDEQLKEEDIPVNSIYPPKTENEDENRDIASEEIKTKNIKDEINCSSFPWEDEDTIHTLLSIDNDMRNTDENHLKFYEVDLINLTEDPGILLLKNQENVSTLVSSTNYCDKDVTGDESWFPWLDPDIINSLVGLDENKDDGENKWETWVFWNQFGTKEEILKAYEEVLLEPTKIKKKENVDIFELVKQEDDEQLFSWLDPEIINSLVSPEKKKNKLESNWEKWGIWNKFGTTEEILEAYENILTKPTKKKIAENIDIDIQDAFWDISLSDDTNKNGDRQLTDIIDNLPAWYSPDILLDSLENLQSGSNKDFANGIIKKNGQDSNGIKPEFVNEYFVMDDIDDIYEDWSPTFLSNEKTHKKSLRRGRKEIKSRSSQISTPSTDKKIPKRPGTPTITTQIVKTDRSVDFEGSSWISTQKISNKEQKVWRTTKVHNRLNSKIYAKQPVKSR